MNHQDNPIEIIDFSGFDEEWELYRAWRVLVVDDDEDVQKATAFALRGVTILDRPIELITALSRNEALKKMTRESDIAVALVDVVMETPDAGLKLVEDLRSAGFAETRIVLRTGYPGYAPELAVATQYEIDDYHTKEELTRTRLISILTTSVRAYERIRAMSKSRKGLELIIESARQIFKRTSLQLFAQGILTQIAALLSLEANGFVSVQLPEDDDVQVITGVGPLAGLIGKSISTADDEITALLEACRETDEPVFAPPYMGLRFDSDSGHALFVVLESPATLSRDDLSLLRLFSSNISVGFRNLSLIEALDRLAFQDAILGLPNLNAFEKSLEEAVNAGMHGQIVKVRVCDFQGLIAAYGRPVAIQLMQEAYSRLDGLCGHRCPIAKVAEGTFGIIDRDCRLTPELLAETLSRHYAINGVDLAMQSTSVLLELRGLPADPTQIARTAAGALLHITRQRSGEHVRYDDGQRRSVEREGMLQAALKQSTDIADSFEIYLQGKVNLSDRRLCGAEALVRWTLNGEMVSPAEFIPIAERSGLTRHITETVLTHVARWSANHRTADGRTLPVAINLSMADLNMPGFSTWLSERAKALGLTPETLEFEITEAVAMREGVAAEQVRALSAEGYRISLDDFGVGYASLSHFHRLPISTLKIDRSFINGLSVETAPRNLSSVIVAMTERLGVDCVAEGIETEGQLRALLLIGCRTGQGYLFGRPAPPERFAMENGLVEV
ncbi:EAL domain-containing protein [Martelella endophytica]|uniref:Diguanylate phosphodiesterase n=1 Tax=Martelella endophytica TaxID=1486262 RepID=A0A0D5LS29_MAREN|nr:EAL domain-containing protein [Martelella endophytica]AJY46587.1 hypothetical protein TM49_14335 [Martelella endophytica]